MAASGEPQGAFELLPDALVPPPAEDIAGEVELDEVDPDEFILRVTDDRAIVFACPSPEQKSHWGRFIAIPTVAELNSLLVSLDPVARSVIEAKRLTGALVELHPADREMFATGFRAISEEGGWLQANFRNHGRVARLMRIRPATGVAMFSGGGLALAAIAAQAQAAEMTRSIKEIGLRVNALMEHLQDDQVGAAENAIEQVESLVEMLRAHGEDGVTEADIAVVRSALGDAIHKALQHLKRAVENLESMAQPPTREVEQVLSQQVVDDVVLYLNLSGRLQVTGVQFGLAQVAYEYHTGKPEVAKTRAERVRKSVDAHREEIEGVCGRLTRLHARLRAGSLPSWERAAKEIAISAGQGAAVGAGGGLVVALGPSAAEVIRGGDVEVSGNEDDRPNAVAAAGIGAATGFAGGLAWGTKNVVLDVLAWKPVEERLVQLAAAGSHTLSVASQSKPALDWMRVVTEELAEPAA